MNTKKTQKSIQLFENPLLESLTHVHPLIPLFLWVPIIIAMLLASRLVFGLSDLRVLILGFMGFFTWTLMEYLLHRFIFHFPAKSAWTKRLVYLFHGIHHDAPNDRTRLVMPPLPGILIATLLFFTFRVFTGPVDIYPFFACFLMGYLCYDYIHYALHHFTPKTSAGRYWKQYHMQHHFKEHHAKWGVSSPFWDYVFGTTQEPVKSSIQETGGGGSYTSQ